MKAEMNDRDITLIVRVTIPVTMTFDAGEPDPSPAALATMAIENFMDHPALKNANDLRMFISSISNEDMNLDPDSDEGTGKR